MMSSTFTVDTCSAFQEQCNRILVEMVDLLPFGIADATPQKLWKFLEPQFVTMNLGRRVSMCRYGDVISSGPVLLRNWSDWLWKLQVLNLLWDQTGDGSSL